MFEEGAVYAGELSGHYYFSDFSVPIPAWCRPAHARDAFAGFDQAIRAASAARVALFSVFRNKFSRRRSGAKIAAIAERYADGEIEHIDGISISYEDWHFNVRGSIPNRCCALT